MAYPGTASLVTQGGSDTNGTSFNTASVTLDANVLYFLVVGATQLSGNIDPTQITASGGGTWTRIHEDDVGGVLTKGGALFRSVPSVEYTGVVTISFGATQDRAVWAIIEVTQADIGNNGGDAVIQAVEATPGDTADPSVNLAAFANANNATFGFFVSGQGDTGLPGTDFTELADQAQGSGLSIYVEWRDTNDTTVDVDKGTAAADWFIVAMELAPSTATADVTLTWADNSSIEDGFSIERDDNGGGFVEIDTVAADVTTYDDLSLAAGTYTYRVRAFNANGNSGYSNTDVVVIT